MDNKKISVKMRVVAFSDLPTVQEISYKQIGVGKMKLTNSRINNNISKQEEITENIKEDEILMENNYTQEDLEREGNESLF